MQPRWDSEVSNSRRCCVVLNRKKPANRESAGLESLRFGSLNNLREIEIEEALFLILKIREVAIND